MTTKNILLLLFIFLLMNFNFGNEPILPPYHQFEVSGILVCDTLIDKSNYSVAAWGKNNIIDNEFRQIFNTGLDIEHSLSLTDSLGNYSLLVNSPYFLDSLKIGLIQPQHPPIFSVSYSVDKNNRIADERFFNNEGGSGCNSCSTNETATSRIIKYQYHIDSTKIYLCR